MTITITCSVINCCVCIYNLCNSYKPGTGLWSVLRPEGRDTYQLTTNRAPNYFIACSYSCHGFFNGNGPCYLAEKEAIIKKSVAKGIDLANCFKMTMKSLVLFCATGFGPVNLLLCSK